MRSLLLLFSISAICAVIAPTKASAQTTTTYAYDALGRLTNSTVSNGKTASYQYDASDNRTTVAGNSPPVAVNDAVSTNSNNSVSFDPRSNDNDPENGALVIASVSVPSIGSATITGGGTGISYSPPAGTSGMATFSYTIQDPQAASASATVTVTVNNQAPIAQADTVTTPYNTAVTFNPLSNDYDIESDDITLVSVTAPSSGSAMANPGGPSITYTPASGFSGIATFTYSVQDQQGATNTGNVSVAVSPPTNLPPVAVDDVLYFMLDNPGDTYFYGEIGGWWQNDYDPDAGDTFKLDSINGNSNFSIVTTPSGNKYLRYAGYIGSGHQVVYYTIKDASGATDTAKIDAYFYAE